jgi:cytochrome c-type biogenesis protein CcmE
VDVTPPPGPPAPGEPDDRDLDDGGLDLTPRTDAAGAPTRRGGARRWGAVAVLVVLGVVLVGIVVQARGATLFYKNADEAVAERDELGDSRFRLQGVVEGEPVRGEGDEPTTFVVAYNEVDVKVVHTGSEPALFKAGLPVVVEGRWNSAGTAFDSDRLLVKHTEDYKKADDGDYEEENPDRVDADATGQEAS